MPPSALPFVHKHLGLVALSIAAAAIAVIALLVSLALLVSAIVARVRRPASSTPPLPPVQVHGAGSELGAYEVLHLLPEKRAKGVVVFMPGNPGQPTFYSDFARRLVDSLGVEVVVLGLAGHLTHNSACSLPRAERARTFTMPQQCAHLAARIRPYCDAARRLDLPFCIAGHSIGGTMAIEVARRLRAAASPRASSPAGARSPRSPRRPNASPARGRGAASPAAQPALPPRHAVLAIMPYLENDPTNAALCKLRDSLRSSGARSPLLPSAAAEPTAALPTPPCTLYGKLTYAVVPALVSVYRLLPPAAQRLLGASHLAKLRSPYDEFARREAAHPAAARNLLAFASTELEILDTPYDFEGAGAAQLAREGRLALAYCEKDMWANPEYMLARCAKARVPASLLADGAWGPMLHAFSVGHPDMEGRVADWFCATLRKLWK